MKKFLLALLLIFSFSLLVGCNLDELPGNNEKTEELELEKLDKPVVTIDEDGLASWKKVKNADGYAYIINDGKEKSTTKTSVQLELGDSIKVKALGDGEEYEDSSYSKKVIYEGKDYTDEQTQPVEPPKTQPVQDEITYHAVGGYYNDWTDYTHDNQMKEITLDDLTNTYPEVSAYIDFSKEVEKVLITYNRSFNSGSGWEMNAVIDGQQVLLDGGYSIKVVKAKYDVEDGITYAYSWHPDPKTAAVANLTPDTLFMPNWVETPAVGEEMYGTWADNPAVTGGAGTYSIIFVEYKGTNSYESPKYAMGAVQTMKYPESIPVAEYVIRFHSNDGNDYIRYQYTYTDTETYLNPVEFTREGYKFVGWTTIPYLELLNYYDQAYLGYVFGDIDLYAMWEKETPSEPLTIWVGSESVVAYHELISRYFDENNISAEFTVMGVDTGSAANTFLLDPSAGPDILMTAHDNFGKLLEGTGTVSPIRSESLINQIESNNSDEFLNVCYLSANGEAPNYYGAPVASQTLVLYYNKSYFAGQEYKLSSWEGILEVAQANNKLATAFSGSDGYSYSLFLLAQPYNQSAINVFGTTGTLQLYKNGVQSQCMGYGDDQVAIHKWAQRFINNPNGRNGSVISDWGIWELGYGEAITFVGGPWHESDVAGELGYDNYGVVELPTFTLTDLDAYGSAKAGMTFHCGSFYDAKCLVKNKYSEWDEYLDDIIEYLTSNESQEYLYKTCDTLPASRNVEVGENQLAQAQLAQGNYGIAQPFGYNPKFNVNYYSKGTPDLYLAIHQNFDGVYGSDAAILAKLQEASFIWAKGKYPSSSQEVADWVASR